MALAHRIVCCAYTLALALTAGGALADAPPDLVKLNDGSFFRGVILEKVANDHVDIELPSGERRRFEMRDVAYAGAKPQEAASYGLAVAGPLAHVELRADEPGVTYEVRTGEVTGARGGGSVLAAICAAPCEANLPIGEHRLALSKGEGKTTTIEPVTIAGPARLDAHYVSRAGLRWLGVGTMIVGTAAGTALLVASNPSRWPQRGQGRRLRACRVDCELRARHGGGASARSPAR